MTINTETLFLKVRVIYCSGTCSCKKNSKGEALDIITALIKIFNKVFINDAEFRLKF